MSHAALSPSARHRWSVCPASVRMEAQYPEESSAAADDGTHTHTLIEACLKDYPKTIDPMTFVGAGLKDHAGAFHVDEERAKRAKVCVDYVLSRVAHYFTRDGEPPAVLTERRVDPWTLVERFDMSGTVDIQIHAKDEVELIDYKDGYKRVAAEGNPQLRQYAVGVIAQTDRVVKTIRMTIVQPKAGEPVSRVEQVGSWLEPEVAKLKAEGAAADAPDAPFVPGEDQCRYCRHRNACKARSEVVTQLFQPVPAVDAAPVPIVPLSELVAQQDASKMDAAELRKILEAAPLIRQVLEGAEKEAQRRLEAGQAVPGFKLVSGRGSRAWALDEEQIEKALKGMGVPKDHLYVSKLVSPAQAEKLTWQKKDGTKVTLSPKQLARLEKEYIAKMGGKPTVAPEADPRPALVTDASPLFQQVAAPEAPAEEIPAWLK